VICQNLALCYWAGKKFRVDLNNLKILTSAKPQAESEFVASLQGCAYPLIQLNDDWDDLDEGPFTAGILDALNAHYAEVWSSAGASYWMPQSQCRARG
ncbi:MAG TPA: hypothetical protein VK456_06355, partial [Xanthobacteraceae bacterium]|nr:hypothetical protein [Xanthobacteraceae bacterium]